MKTYYNLEHKLWKLNHPVFGIFIFDHAANRIPSTKNINWLQGRPPTEILSAFNRIVNNENLSTKYLKRPILGFKPYQLFANYCLMFSSKVLIQKSKSTNSVYVNVNGFKVRFSDHPSSSKKFHADASGLGDAIIKYRKSH